MKDLGTELQQRKTAGLYRSRRITESAQNTEITIDGNSLLSFCSNDYLGLANHPDVKQAMKNGLNQYGTGSGSAHLISGHSKAHHALEEELADFIGYPRALLFSTGYMANLGIAQALCNQGDAIFEDRLNHASLLDAALLSGARLQRYGHLDIADLDNKLSASKKKEKMVMTDSVFSMDGDIAPVAALAKACSQHQTWLMIDDAHGFGVLGEQGKGTLERLNVATEDVPIYMATLGKAAGTAGAFVAGSDDLIEYLIQHARTYVYTTAMPPALAEATRASLKLIQNENWRREQIQILIKRFRSGAQQLGLQLMDSDTAIQPIIIGNSQKATEISQQLLNKKILISAIRPPTVPEGSARLRITLSAEHTEQQVDYLLGELETIFKPS
jgi:8-amino-7-oxononanoate synthase